MSKLRLAKQRIDNRQNFRVSGRNPLDVKVLRCRAHRAIGGRRFSAVTEDISVTGIRFRGPIELSDGVALKLLVHLAYDSQKYRLQGVVQWCRAVPDSEELWEVGVGLLDSTSRANRNWTRAVYDIIRSRSQVTHIDSLLQPPSPRRFFR